MGPYMFGRLLHAIFAAGITVGLMKATYALNEQGVIPVILQLTDYHQGIYGINRLQQIYCQLTLFFVLITVLSLAFYMTKWICQSIKK